MSAVMIVLVVGLIVTSGAQADCADDDPAVFRVALMCITIGFISAGIVIAIVAVCVFLFYFTDKQIAYSANF